MNMFLGKQIYDLGFNAKRHKVVLITLCLLIY